MMKLLALWTAVTFLRRLRAISKDASAIRAQACAVILRKDSATPSIGMNSPGPHHVAVGVHALRAFAHDDEIHLVPPRCGTPRSRFRRADVGEEIEFDPDRAETLTPPLSRGG